VEGFSQAGMGLMLLASAALGVRLLLLARRTHMLPELVMGIASLGTGVGAVLVVQGAARMEVQQAFGAGLLDVGIFLTSIGAAFLCAGMWRIFRVGQLWALLVTILAGIVLAASCFVLFGADHGGRSPTEHPAYWVGFGVRIASFGWAAAESLRYAALLRRRAALGLSEPLMVHRFLGWGISAFTMSVAYLIFLFFMVRGMAPPAAAQSVLGMLGLITAFTLWAAFFPPAFYQRWVLARCEERADAVHTVEGAG